MFKMEIQFEVESDYEKVLEDLDEAVENDEFEGVIQVKKVED